MTKFNFYVSSSQSSTGLYKLLPSLLEKIIAKNHKVLIACNNKEIEQQINKFLWEYSKTSFLPHGPSSSEFKKNQPILITSTGENENNADILITFSGKTVENISSFLQVFDIFESSEAQLQAGRKRWKEYKSKGYDLSYFTSEKGHWIKKI